MFVQKRFTFVGDTCIEFQPEITGLVLKDIYELRRVIVSAVCMQLNCIGELNGVNEFFNILQKGIKIRAADTRLRLAAQIIQLLRTFRQTKLGGLEDWGLDA